jgi:hypothetical protein
LSCWGCERVRVQRGLFGVPTRAQGHTHTGTRAHGHGHGDTGWGRF